MAGTTDTQPGRASAPDIERGRETFWQYGFG